MAEETLVGGSTSAGKRILQGLNIPVYNPDVKVKPGLKGKYSFENAWQAATTMPKSRIEQDPRWKSYFERKQKRREEVIRQSKQPGESMSKKFLTETIDGIPMTPEQAAVFKRKQYDIELRDKYKIDPSVMSKATIDKAKQEYLAQLPKDRVWTKATVNTKYGGVFPDGSGAGFDDWFTENYINKAKLEDSFVPKDQQESFQNILSQISSINKVELPQNIMAPKEDYLKRGDLSYLKTPEEQQNFEETLKTGDKAQRKEALVDLAKTAPVFFNMAAFGNPWATRNLESFTTSGARRSDVFGPSAYRRGPGLGQQTVYTLNNYPTYGRSV